MSSDYLEKACLAVLHKLFGRYTKYINRLLLEWKLLFEQKTDMVIKGFKKGRTTATTLGL